MRQLALCLALVLPLAAHATPPRILSMSDRLVGLSNEALFVERVVEDNLGYHVTTFSDILLVKIPFDGSAPEFHPLRSVLEDGHRAFDEGQTVAVEEAFLGAEGLHDLLAREGAAPRHHSPTVTPEWTVTNDGDSGITLSQQDGPTFHLDARAAAKGHWQSTLDALPVAGRNAREVEIFDYEIATCVVRGVRDIWFPDDRPIAFAFVACGNEYETQFVSFWLRLDPA